MEVLYGLGAFVAFIAVATAVYQLRLSRHPGIPRNGFIRHFCDLDVPEAISSAVYDYYRSGAISRKFGVAPDDQLADLFSDLDEDIGFDAIQLTKTLGMEVAVGRNLEIWGKPLITIRDMVLWLDWVRKNAGAKEAAT